MALKDKEKWNNKYATRAHSISEEPSDWLKDHSGLLPGQGICLEIAAGGGRNAIYAASLGYRVLAVDISEVVLRKAQERAKMKNAEITTVVADLDTFDIPENAFDLIMGFIFLDRRLFPQIIKGLKPGGVLIYETFNEDHLKYTGFRKEWVLGYNELLRAFKELRILGYREEEKDESGYASLIARKESVTS